MTRTGSRLTSLLVAVMLTISLGACATWDSASSVTLLGPWTDDEETYFTHVLQAFEDKTRIRVSYRGTRALNEVLASEVQQGTPPDIAILFSAGELARYVRGNKVKPLDNVIGSRQDAYTKQWLDLQKLGDDKQYGVVVKANLKSIIWFNPAHFSPPMPETWDELLALSQNMAGPAGTPTTSTPWCMGMGSTPTSGWPGTDWIEDILLHQSGTEIYRQWVAGTLPWASPPIREAWTTWGAITADVGPRAALLTDFKDAGRPMFTDPPGCFLHHQPSFTMVSYQSYRDETGQTLKPGTHFDFFPFPEFGPQSGDLAAKTWEVSADLAVMFNDTPQARQLIQYLATEQAQRIWPAIPQGGAFSINKNVPLNVYSDDVSQRIADTLTAAGTLCYDAADLMPATMRNAFYRAVMEYLSDPSQLDSILLELDRVRLGVEPEEWLDFPCGQVARRDFDGKLE